ncbi:hypothetical protein ND450_25530 [Lentzea sp. HUAS12]|nr:hypothetical protein [Lentzea sp. HUAS12]USX48821.1 hypothetical protein ND450_25530 [Lentzea sp. HUAS12]
MADVVDQRLELGLLGGLGEFGRGDLGQRQGSFVGVGGEPLGGGAQGDGLAQLGDGGDF